MEYNNMLELSIWEKLAILAGVAVFFAIIIGILMCIFGLRFYKPITARRKRSTTVLLKGIRPEFLIPITRGHAMQYKSNGSEPGMVELMHQPQLIDSETVGLLKDDLKQMSSDEVEPMNQGQLEFTLTYDSLSHILNVTILQAKNLPPAYFHGHPDSSITLKLVRLKIRSSLHKWFRQHKDENLNQNQEFSTSVKSSRNPEFNETFTLYIPASDLKYFGLKFYAKDFDKYSRGVTTGQIVFSLAKLNLADASSCHFVETFQLQQICGELSFSVSYLPTSEKISFIILKARDLKTSEDKIEFYVKILLFLRGKLLKKKRTSVIKHDHDPVFNETISFDIPTKLQDDVVFTLIVTTIMKDTATSVVPAGAKHEEVGRTWVGKPCGGVSEQHWTDAVTKPRKHVARWHHLH